MSDLFRGQAFGRTQLNVCRICIVGVKISAIDMHAIRGIRQKMGYMQINGGCC